MIRSPARVAGDTAEALGLEAETDPALRDLDPGRWAGRTLTEIEAAEPDAVAEWLTDPSAAPHGGDSVAVLLHRIAGWLDGLAGSERAVLAITHAAVIRAACVHALRAPPSAFWRIDVAPLATARLVGGPERWTLAALVPPP